MSKLRTIWWELGAALPESIQQVLGISEKEFFSGFDSAMSDFSNHYPELDLTGDLDPPKDTYIDVLHRESNEIVTEHKSVVLSKQGTVFMKRSDVVSLIRRGNLEQIISRHE